ncbi:MAG: hypothetical protein CM15mV111_090 [uncultured marine virus]|nr:MAG: hypothetical protein CM15mV111_090 [uncultured marine virus]
MGAAPVGAPADYGALEQQFVESLRLVLNTLVGLIRWCYDAGGLEFPSMSTDEPLSLEEGLKTAAMLRAAYEFRDPIMKILLTH